MIFGIDTSHIQRVNGRGIFMQIFFDNPNVGGCVPNFELTICNWQVQKIFRQRKKSVRSMCAVRAVRKKMGSQPHKLFRQSFAGVEFGEIVIIRRSHANFRAAHVHKQRHVRMQRKGKTNVKAIFQNSLRDNHIHFVEYGQRIKARYSLRI